MARDEENADDVLWAANFPDSFCWAEWEDEAESVLFHQGSGETLLLNPLGAFLLRTLCRQRSSAEALCRLAERHFELPRDDELCRAVRNSLRVFEQKGLAVPAP